MTIPTDTKNETWGLIVLDSTASSVLLLVGDRGLALPKVEIPSGRRVANELRERVRSELHLDTFCLRELAPTSGSHQNGGARWFLLETTAANCGEAVNRVWRKFCERPEQSLQDQEDQSALTIWYQEVEKVRVNRAHPRIGDPATFARIRDWVRQVLSASGDKLRSEFQQLNAERDFSLIRFETERGAVWFKAVGEPNTREFSLSVHLANRFPLFTAPIIGTEPLWNAWLCPEVPGCRLSQRDDHSAWIMTAGNLATLQAESVEEVDRVLACKSRDVRSLGLRDLISPFFRRLAEFMARQTTATPPPLSIGELRQLEHDLASSLEELEAEGVPDSLGHLDLNPNNLIVLPERTIFLDWAEGCIGHPFFTFAYLLEHFRSHFPGTELRQMVKAYADVWQERTSFEDIERTLVHACLVAILVHAISTDFWRDESVSRLPDMEGYYRSLARRMKSYANRIGKSATISSLWN